MPIKNRKIVMYYENSRICRELLRNNSHIKKKLGVVRSIDIANELNYTKPSVSVAMKRLRENVYINMDNNGHISLTEQGLFIAESIYERHQLLSKYLIAIGVSEKIALEDACRIEHVISGESFEKIKEHFNWYMQQK